MTPERWKQVDELLEVALEQEPERRSAFLDKACAGDTELRREVEAFLDAHQHGAHVLSSAALEVAHEELFKERAKSLVGQDLSHYQILSILGEGGMGVVYQARDSKLRRLVAIKVLPRHLVADRERQRRFVQEARAASALNHPNIVTIYEIASSHGIDFIVMEHVSGKTLDRVIDPGETQNLAVQFPERIKNLEARLQKIRRDGRSRP